MHQQGTGRHRLRPPTESANEPPARRSLARAAAVHEHGAAPPAQLAAHSRRAVPPARVLAVDGRAPRPRRTGT